MKNKFLPNDVVKFTEFVNGKKTDTFPNLIEFCKTNYNYDLDVYKYYVIDSYEKTGQVWVKGLEELNTFHESWFELISRTPAAQVLFGGKNG